MGNRSTRVKAHISKPNLYSLFFFLILFCAAFLRFYCLSCSSLWHDEGNTWALTARTFPQIAAAAAADIHPPGYYWLLKAWTTLFGRDVIGLRSFSALAGTLSVGVIYAIARTAMPHARFAPLLAALIAALNPFQIYYSQEARMYALLMLESALLLWALLRWTASGRHPSPFTLYPSLFTLDSSPFLYLLAAIAGLWTHYIFPLLLAAGALAYLWDWGHKTRFKQFPWAFILVNTLALFVFLPWLPTAIERVLHWPAGGESVALLDGLRLTLHTLITGPIRTAPDLAGGWLLLAAILPLFGLWRLRHSPAGVALLLWLLAPIGVMFGLGLFSQAFLKFLLVASPAWCVAVGTLVAGGRWQAAGNITHHALRITHYTLPLMIALIILPPYYTDPTARDNYAGMAATVAALGDTATDLVILNAPGQADVWSYYDPGLPVLALPTMRPADGAATQATLSTATAGRRQIFALFWATDEADPDGVVEGWLNRHAFKGLESWQGNVRFVVYSQPLGLRCQPLEELIQWGEVATLSDLCLPADGLSVAPGESLLLGLTWQPIRETKQRYKVTLQLLDTRNQVLAQRDSEPAGGSAPTLGWKAGETVHDNHALFIPPGTPPGSYRLMLAIYDAETGVRLPVQKGDSFDLGNVRIERGHRSLPTAILPMQQRLAQTLGSVTLLGYDAYVRGYAHDPQRPLQPGDMLHVTLYWQAPDPLPADWPAEQTMTLDLGESTLTAPLAGGLYATGLWQPGDLIRGEFDLPYTAGDALLSVQVGEEGLSLGKFPITRK